MKTKPILETIDALIQVEEQFVRLLLYPDWIDSIVFRDALEYEIKNLNNKINDHLTS